MQPTDSPQMPPRRLTQQSFRQGLDYLRQQDADLALVMDRHGPPPLWARTAGFATMVRIILEQQVSLASAKAAYERLVDASHSLTPQRFIQFDKRTLKRFGFSRQKTAYCQNLARLLLNNKFDLRELERMSDESARAALLDIKGIGPWTADIYMLMALRRPDIWPRGDLALAVGTQKLKRLKERPTSDDLGALSESWRPWRAVAARVIWHYYLSD